MGTYYSQVNGTEMEAEQAAIDAPEQIISIHRAYIDAGADFIRTDTFAVNHNLFPTPELRRAAVRKAVYCAREAVKRSGRDVAIAASIGPIRQQITENEFQVDEEYRELVDDILDEGLDTFALETFADLDELEKIAEYIKSRNPKAFILGEFSLNPMGYTKYGFGMQDIVNDLEDGRKVDAFGFNCGVGVTHMKRLMDRIEFHHECIFSTIPNAGYPQVIRGRMRYGDTPEHFADIERTMLRCGTNIVGGCCGTTPAHIAAIRKMLDGRDKKTPLEKTLTAPDPCAVKQGPIKLSPFMTKLNAGEKVFVVELDSPFDANVEKFSRGVYDLAENDVDMITVSDSPLARPRADASLLACYGKRVADVEIMPHVACRDRNLIGLRSEFLGAHVNGIRDFLIITGDPVDKDSRNSISGVFDMNSIRLMRYVSQMNREVFRNDPVYFGGALNYAGSNVKAIEDRMMSKIYAGCSYFLTQPVFTDDDVERIRLLKKDTGARIICGLMPLVSYRNALFMHNEMPGIHVDSRILGMYNSDQTREESEEVAVKICLDAAVKLRDVADGYYIMTPFHRVTLVNRIINAIRREILR